MRSLFFLILTFYFINLNGQTITNYTSSDGLIDNFVECVAVDINDNVWFGTSVGLQMFDGVNWTSYNTANYPAMVNDNIKVLSTTSNGDVWIGTDFGASRFDGINWYTYSTSTMQSIPLISNQIKSIDQDPNTDIVWIGTNLGVTPVDLSGSTNSISIGSPDLHWSGVNATSFNSNGDVWFSSPLGGATHYDGVNFTYYDTADGLLSQNATDILIDNLGNKWIGTGGGISVLNQNNSNFIHYTRMYVMPPPDTLNPVVDIEKDSYGRIWVGIYVGYLAEGGVAYWNGNQWHDYDISDGIVGSNIKDIAIDSQNNIWVATSTGVSKISALPNSIDNISTEEILIFPNPSTGNFTIQNNGNIQHLYIYDILGNIIVSKSINHTSNIDLDLSSMAKGIYKINTTENRKNSSTYLLLK